MNECALTGDGRLLISVWNQHRPRPFPCGIVILTHRICFRYGVQRGVWLWNTDFGNWKTSCSVRLFAERIVTRVWKSDCGEKCARAKMEMLGIMRKAKNMVFQPQYALCFTATTSLPQTYDFNLQYQNPSTSAKYSKYKNCKFPTVSDALYNQSYDFFRYFLDKTVMKNEYSEFFYLFQIKL
jgi:hypothetical protein